ncbi:hypothetical protein FDECE_12604 [Fusarium decemcellulare]|nr:hypothetical protein FDECE_12604 [Fusarium decemcellulare]
MFYLENRLGAQSNVLISAHYAPTTATQTTHLSKDAVYAATRSVLEVYPELSMIAIPQATKKGTHHLVMAALHEIDLETCVEFLDDAEPKCTPEVVERFHNEWPWTDDKFHPRKPWWKVVVLGRQEVAFVFHHVIADGRFGQFFHREFLTALNSYNKDKGPSSLIIKIDPARVRLSKELEEFWISSYSVIYVIHTFIILLLMRLFFRGKLLFNDVPKPKPHFNSAVDEAPPESRTVSRVAGLRISSPRMRRIVSACREQKTSFTPFFLTMLMCTVACDYYPNAKVGISNCAIDTRPVYPQDKPGSKSGKLLQCSAGVRKLPWLDNYRRVFSSQTAEDLRRQGEKKTGIDVDGAWELVRGYRASIMKALEGKEAPAVVIFKASNGVSPDLEGMLKQNFPAMGLHLNNCVALSNLGSFSVPDQQGPWKVDDMSFSAAPVHGNISYEISIHVSGAEGGDTVINASYQDGVLTEEMVSGILNGALTRMEALL